MTGASGGIGSEIARVLSEAGADVALSGTRVDKLEEVAAALPGKTAVLPCNLASLAEVDHLVPMQKTHSAGSIFSSTTPA